MITRTKSPPAMLRAAGLAVAFLTIGHIAEAQTLTTMATFTGGNGRAPYGTLIADANGNLFGTSFYNGALGYGTVFEIPYSAGTYGPMQTLVSFGNTNGANPFSSLAIDASGNLFGTTQNGGGSFKGTVFEIPKSGAGYGSLQSLASFNGTNGSQPAGNLAIDASGNLFGTASSGGSGSNGVVFELPKSGAGYGSLQTLANFNLTNGATPYGGVTIDAAGNLFGTTSSGGSASGGTVFEVPKSGAGYGSLQTLTNLTTTIGKNPLASVAIDASGNLFGTTSTGGTNNLGTVFELPNSGASYGSPVVLASLSNGIGAQGYGGVIIDANGSLFGTAYSGGAQGVGAVFEIAHNAGGYAPIQNVVSLTSSGAGGTSPWGGLHADANGNLIGTTESGGSSAFGTVYKVSNSGFAVSAQTAVPEPASLALFAWAGLIPLARRLRRRAG